MNNFLKNADFGKLIFRLVFGGLMCVHGVMGLMKGPEAWTHTGAVMAHVGLNMGHTIWGLIAVAIQAIGGFCFLSGLFFRQACLLLTGVMGMAVLFHVKLGDSFLSAGGQAALFAAAFLAFMFVGSGSMSIQKDH